MDLSAHNLDLIVRHGSLTIEFVRTIVLWLGRLTIPSQSVATTVKRSARMEQL